MCCDDQIRQLTDRAEKAEAKLKELGYVLGPVFGSGLADVPGSFTVRAEWMTRAELEAARS